jgi:hypothetical protein
MRKHRICLLVWLVVVASAASCVPASTVDPARDVSGLLVAWVQGGDLMLWESSEAHTLTSSGVVQPIIAPGGERIAFTRGMSGQPETLWIIDTDGSEERQIDAPPLIGHVEWLDGDTLYFNTLTPDPLGPIPREDLYRVDVNTSEVTAITPGGDFTVSDDSSALILVTAGIYGEEPGRIYAVDATDTDDPALLLEFPAVATGAHYRFYPAVQRENGAAVRVAIPHPDSVYDADGSGPPVALWQLGTDGESEQIGSVPASYFGLPVWSPDGGLLAYLRRSPDHPNRFALDTAAADGSDAAPYAVGDAGTISPPLWIPGSNRFVYAQDGALWLGERGENPRQIAELGTPMTPPLALEGVIVYVSVGDETVELRHVTVDGAASELIASIPAIPVFDAALRR